MRPSADAGDTDGFDAFARALQSTFPAGNDASLALALLRLLSEGRPVTPAALAQAANRTAGEVVGRLSSWPNVERDEAGQVVAFSGLTLRPTAHGFRVGTRRLHTWCAWDTLFLPALIGSSIAVGSTCPATAEAITLAATPNDVQRVQPASAVLSIRHPDDGFSADTRASFCRHAHFLASEDAFARWAGRADGTCAVSIDDGFEIAQRVNLATYPSCLAADSGAPA